MSATIRKASRKAHSIESLRHALGVLVLAMPVAALLGSHCMAQGPARAEQRSGMAQAVARQASATTEHKPVPAVHNATLGGSPAELLARSMEALTPSAGELLSPGSRAWAGARALTLRLRRPELLLAEGVIAHSGGARMAAASRSDGTVLLFDENGGARPRTLTMPEGHPAFALGLSADGAVLAAWSQGTGEIVFFDLAAGKTSAASQPMRLLAPLSGAAALTLSADGRTLAAHDDSGALWAGLRGGELRPLGALPGKPALLDFSPGGGVLVAVASDGSGRVWNPRTGKSLRVFSVPGGPFVRGDVVAGLGQVPEHSQIVRLWTASGELVRWDVVHGAVAEGAVAPQGPEGSGAAGQASPGLLRQRGDHLFYVGEGRSWSAAPDYEPMPLALSWSPEQRCLRLQDLDGAVRYYSSESGAPKSQCFAVDWSPVPIKPDGGASIPGLALRVLDRLARAEDGWQVNARAISSSHVHLWTVSADRPVHVSAATNSGSIAVSQSVVETAPVSLPLRGGLADEPTPRMVRLGR